MAVLCTRPPTVRFVQIRNEWARDSRLSLKAAGLLTYLHSHEDGYELSTAQMVRDHTDGKDAVRTGLEELEAAGYLTRARGRGDGGRWGEVDYVLSDPFDAEGRIIRRSPAEDRRETRQSGLSGAANPARINRPIEDQGEKTIPVPSEPAGQLRLVEETPSPTVNQRADRLAKEHYEASGKLGGSRAFLGLRGIVAEAVTAGHAEEQIRAALAHLRSRGRSVTRAALGPLLADADASRAVSGNGYGPRGHPPHRNSSAPGAYEGPL